MTVTFDAIGAVLEWPAVRDALADLRSAVGARWDVEEDASAQGVELASFPGYAAAGEAETDAERTLVREIFNAMYHSFISPEPAS